MELAASKVERSINDNREKEKWTLSFSAVG